MLSSGAGRVARLAVPAAVVAAWGVAGAFAAVELAACGSLGVGENGAFPGDGSIEAGSEDAPFGSFGDGGHHDAGADTGADAGGPPTTALFVHASTSLESVRLCWSSGGVTTSALPFPTGIMPASNYPGIPRGGAAMLDDASELAGSDAILYAVDARTLTNAEGSGTTPLPCLRRVCPPGDTDSACLPDDNRAYWSMPIPAGAVRRGAANVIAIEGCWPTTLDSTASNARCGADWTTAGGNLHVRVLTPSAPTISTVPRLYVQAAQLSVALAQLAGDAGDAGAVISFGTEDAGDAAAVVATLPGLDTLEPAYAVALTLPPGIAAYGTVGFAVDAPGADGGSLHLWTSLAEAQRLVDPTQDPTQFFGGSQTYVVAVVGDPASADTTVGGASAGEALHLLVVPAAPALDGGSE